MNWIINKMIKLIQKKLIMGCHHEVKISLNQDPQDIQTSKLSVNFIPAAPVRECHACFANPDYHEFPPQQQADDGHDG